MFYSHDILGRRGPLGFIWSMAHGKRLSKQKLMGISLSDICKQILAPDVPHSLRLQGILMGGVALVFAKQQMYLLEDLQEMTKHVRDATSPAAHAEGGGASVAPTLKRGKDKARAEAITMGDADADILGQGAGTEDLLLTVPDGLDLPEDDMHLFLVPSLGTEPDLMAPNALESDAHPTGTGGRASGASLPAQQSLPRLAPRSGGAAQPAPRPVLPPRPANLDLAMDEEMFPALEGDEFHMTFEGELELLEGPMFDFTAEEGLPTAGELLPASEGQPLVSEGVKEATPSLSARAGTELAVAAEGQGGEGGEAEEGGDAMVAIAVGETPEQKEKRAKQEGKRQRAEGGPVVKAQAKRTKLKGTRGATAVDSLEDLQIRVAVYRQWTQDTSDIVRSGRAGAGFRSRGARGAPTNGDVYTFGKCGALPLTELCPPLAELYARCLSRLPVDQLAEDGRKLRARTAAEGTANGTGEEHEGHEEEAAGRLTTPRGSARGSKATGTTEDRVLGAEGMVVDQQEGAYELHMGAMAMDFEMGAEGMAMEVEVERLRAAGITPNVSGDTLRAARLGLDLGSAKAPSALDTAGRSKATSGTSLSSGLSPESEAGLRAPKSRLFRPSSSMAPLSPIHDAPSDGMQYGQGMLEDLLPPVGEAGEAGEELGEALFDLPDTAAQAAVGKAPFSSGRLGTLPDGITQFSLLESAGNGTQPKELIGRSTLVVLEVFRRRLSLAQQQQEQERQQQHDDDQDLAPQADGSPARSGEERAAPAVELSFFDLVQGLKRTEAVKLFYQVLVTHSTSFIQAKQDQAYGDIRITAGRLI